MEIVIRAFVVYVGLWLILRAMGKRELSEVTAFELVVLVVLGDIVQQGVTQEDMSVTGSLLAVSTMALLAVASSQISLHVPRARGVLEGRPSVVLRDGRILHEPLRRNRMTVDEVHEAARKRGITDLGTLSWVIVEADGKFSFIERDPDRSAGAGDDDDADADDGAEGHQAGG